MAAAVGSLMIRATSSPAMVAAARVACRWASSKYAGTVMTAFLTVSPSAASARCFTFFNISADNSCGVKSR